MPPPSTPADLRRALADIKRQHVNRRYRACAAQCGQILASILDRSTVEPLHLIYVHFYAAISIELCARPLAASSAGRAAMLAEARAHLAKASDLVPAAEDSVARRLRPLAMTAKSARWSCSSSTSTSNLSSRPSSMRAPSSLSDGSSSSFCDSAAESINSSRGTSWSTMDSLSRRSTPMSSPTTSVCSFEDMSHKSAVAGRRAVKKVSFSLPAHAGSQDDVDEQADEHIDASDNTRRSSIASSSRRRSSSSSSSIASSRRRSSSSSSTGSTGSTTREKRRSMGFKLPIVRPDSPTLGFDDKYFQDGAARQGLPEVPPRNRRSSRDLASKPTESTFFVEDENENGDEHEDDHDHENASPRPSNDSPALRAFQTFHQHCEQLAGLRTQLARHTGLLDDLLLEQARPVLGGRRSPLPDMPVLSGGAALVDHHTTHSRSGSSSSKATEGTTAMRDDAKALDRRARIERLRASGWQRRRFDPRPYQDLCDRVVQEMVVAGS